MTRGRDTRDGYSAGRGADDGRDDGGFDNRGADGRDDSRFENRGAADGRFDHHGADGRNDGRFDHRGAADGRNDGRFDHRGADGRNDGRFDHRVAADGRTDGRFDHRGAADGRSDGQPDNRVEADGDERGFGRAYRRGDTEADFDSDNDGRRTDGERRTTEPVGTVTVAQMLKRACEVLRDARRVLLTSHRRPDGDGTGSMAGLASLLRAQGKEAVIYSVDPIARRYKWLPLVAGTVQTIPFDDVFDCTIVVDCADMSLLGDTLPPPEVCGVLITLDHHASGHPFGDIPVWDPTAAAVGVLVHRIAEHEGWEITPEAAVPLYVSLISDTGGFRHANTNAEALRVGSELIRAGVVPATIASSLEERPSPGKLRLLGSVLSTLELHCAGRVGVLSVTTDMVEGARASWEDIEGMVNWARNVEGVQVGVLLTTAKGGGVRVSMRSRSERVDVGKVCMTLGGGGHPGAGGCHLNADLTNTKEKVVRALELAFNRISQPVIRISPTTKAPEPT